MTQSPVRQNHYVPIWYQKGFVADATNGNALYVLDLDPPKTRLPDGRFFVHRSVNKRPPKSCFWAEDLYTTRFGATINDEIERFLFGQIDNDGAIALRALAKNNQTAIHEYFQRFFEYLDAQKLRTPKGLDWIRRRYPSLSQLDLMLEMQALRRMHCTMWYESVREIVSAEGADVKFLVTDHPVTVYNAAFPPESATCNYPDDPAIDLKGTQTVFVLDGNNCLILTNLEYAKNPTKVELASPRTHARYYGSSIARTDAFIRTRKLTNDEVHGINQLLKARASRYVAAGQEDWLYPEKSYSGTWQSLANTLLPPPNELWHFGGEIYIGYKDGSTDYRDEFGRTSGAHKYLRKSPPEKPPSPNDRCGCGSGKKFNACCQGKPDAGRPAWDVYSIRERNLILTRAAEDILGLADGKTWEDVRTTLTDDQVKKIYETVEALWPRDTDIVELLPRPDDRYFRALYLGLIDPRTVATCVVPWLAYFDEIVIPNPFVNPSYMKAEYSPVHSPASHKAQTLKNVFLLLMLEPFIAKGYVHMIPDPSDFNADFRRAMWPMAEERAAHVELPKRDEEHYRTLLTDDYGRAIRSLPKDSLRQLLQRSSPELDENQLDETVEYMKQQQAADPLALMQPMNPGREKGEFQIVKSFNLELGLFYAQFTGSVIYTDLQVHWEQLHSQAALAHSSRPPSEWNALIDRVGGIDFPLDADLTIALQIRDDNRLGEIRSAFRRAVSVVRSHAGRSVSKKDAKQLAEEWRRAKKNIRRDWQELGPTSDPSTRFRGRLDLAAPSGGFQRNTVRRLLLTFGRLAQVDSVPMAMFTRVM